MESYDSEFEVSSGRWKRTPEEEAEIYNFPGVSRETVEEINGVEDAPAVERHSENHWVQKFSEAMGGLFLKASALERPTVGGDHRTTYSLHILRFFKQTGPVDVGHFERSEVIALRDFLNEVIESSEGS